MASLESFGKGLLQFSQVGLMSSICFVLGVEAASFFEGREKDIAKDPTFREHPNY